MKTPVVFLLFTSVFLLGSSALAADDDVIIDRTVIHQNELAEPSAFKNEAFGIKPQFGVTTRQVGGSSDAHAVAGVLFDFNFLRRAADENGDPYVGVSFGGLYSHLGTSNSDILGLNGTSGDSGSNFVEIPLNLKVGYTFSDVFRLTAHGGALPIYQSNPTNLPLDTWTWNGNVGADLEFGVGKNIGLLLRPDWAFASNDTFFTGTFGVDIPIT